MNDTEIQAENMLTEWFKHDIEKTDYLGAYNYEVFCLCGWSQQYENVYEAKAEVFGKHLVDNLIKARLVKPELPINNKTEGEHEDE